MAPPLKLGLVSLGCPKNLADSEVALGLAKAAGFELTSHPEEADCLVVNTCGFLESARAESINTILEMAAYKQEGRCRGLVVTGCMGERYALELANSLPEVDAILGTTDYQRLPALLQRLAAGGAAEVVSPAVGSRLYPAELPREPLTAAPYRYVKIGDGCANGCTFCSIPLMRGRFASPPVDDLLRQMEGLAGSGVREAILIAQDTTAYGVDRPEAGEELATLLRALERQGAVEWIRLLYAYPGRLTAEVIELLATGRHLLPYVDLPLQHIDDHLLRRMGRRGSEPESRALVARLREAGIALRTTFITGFPGETEAAFERLAAFVTEGHFDWLGCFTYSPEEGTAAVGLAGAVDPEVAAARAERLMELQGEVSRARLAARVGTVEAVLVEGESAESDLLLAGRTRWMAPEIDGVVYLTDSDGEPPVAGEIVAVEITRSHDHDLEGRVVRARVVRPGGGE
ncbi:MAG: 30S ribosomal protein S12 methylthiotransferase RimO [Nitrospirae bacterium CG18_big_fil_WC_8_21_14_2_50_70_55]|nr:30S ribosomal protein S12 methylthiotransferase RimO [Deltaproteobacteria bacterium]OIP65401.1 MAG: ribosomal protein S12 methylthiotransferase RimO [Nitrospirae bacterium CG2_30_70_394]PIQ06953.1 MAG: 30S ribosomal protein S12 methylthiotransferase RimO [Nitrospirae bacterium CG18_big_fil_WC_8_21_14_2_50_70_55]PIU79149.1 MAG: 30S ribosomal protein S12 methylthiotransferase RimO [Nitrospirae bacterium CG06_land_8_20_14_3_00_70_43]PIW82121.1 MAG: 30S ribosomal protein S12 methylthiotransferas